MKYVNNILHIHALPSVLNYALCMCTCMLYVALLSILCILARRYASTDDLAAVSP